MSAAALVAAAGLIALLALTAIAAARAVLHDRGVCIHCGEVFPLEALPAHEDDCAGPLSNEQRLYQLKTTV